MFDMDYQFFPSIHQICEGLSEAKSEEETSEGDRWTVRVDAKDHFDMKMDGLIELFDTCTKEKRYEPLTPKILSNTQHYITKALLKAYTSETLNLYQEINQMMRSKDFQNNWQLIN